jgi:hypothetical protein
VPEGTPHDIQIILTRLAAMEKELVALRACFI